MGKIALTETDQSYSLFLYCCTSDVGSADALERKGKTKVAPNTLTLDEIERDQKRRPKLEDGRTSWKEGTKKEDTPGG